MDWHNCRFVFVVLWWYTCVLVWHTCLEEIFGSTLKPPPCVLVQLAPGSCDLSQAEKRMPKCFVKLSKFTEWHSKLSWMNKVVILSENSYHFGQFAQLYMTIILFSAWDKSRDPGANWSKLEHMWTTFDNVWTWIVLLPSYLFPITPLIR